jgi:hypothetical protein
MQVDHHYRVGVQLDVTRERAGADGLSRKEPAILPGVPEVWHYEEGPARPALSYGVLEQQELEQILVGPRRLHDDDVLAVKAAADPQVQLPVREPFRERDRERRVPQFARDLLGEVGRRGAPNDVHPTVP